MKVTGFVLLLFCLFTTTGKPLQTDSPVVAVPGEHVVLPCRPVASAHPDPVTVVEWLRVDGPSPVTVHVEREGLELVREKAGKYVGRTAMLKDFSLKLLGVTQQDSGSYKCIIRPKATDEVSVSLFVGEVPEVNMTLQRTSANQMFVQWESAGWRLEPQVSLLDVGRNQLPAQTEVSLGSEGLYFVRSKMEAAVAKGDGTIIFRVGIPGTSMAQEKLVSVTDEFNPPEADPFNYVVLVFIIVLVVPLSVVVFVLFVSLDRFQKLKTSLHHLTEVISGTYRKVSTADTSLLSLNDDTRYQEYGDINDQVTTTGTSQELHIDNQHLTGVEASQRLAEKDLGKMMEYRGIIISVGDRLGVRPAVIAAIISRQSCAGTMLRPDGFGKGDSTCFGLMQISKNYHAVKGGPYSEEHVDEGVTFLIQLILTMRRFKPNWSKLQHLKGALACYIAGEDKVLKLIEDEDENVDVDSVTPGRDFVNDVIARAKWFTKQGF